MLTMIDRHVVQSRTDVSEETHEEKGHLEHRVLDEVDSLQYFIVPIGGSQIGE